MNVIGHQKAFWFLLQDGEDYYLDVNSGNSYVGYSIAFQLNEVEVGSYLSRKEAYITELATNVNHTQKRYQDREVTKEVTEKMHSVIMSYKEGNSI